MTLCVLCTLASPLESAVPKNGSANPLESALAKSLDLKPPEINTYRKEGVAPPSSAKLTSTGAQTRIPFPVAGGDSCWRWTMSAETTSGTVLDRMVAARRAAIDHRKRVLPEAVLRIAVNKAERVRDPARFGAQRAARARPPTGNGSPGRGAHAGGAFSRRGCGGAAHRGQQSRPAHAGRSFGHFAGADRCAA